MTRTVAALAGLRRSSSLSWPSLPGKWTGGAVPPGHVPLGLVLLGFVLLPAAARPAHGQVRLTQEEALRLAFPEADTVVRETAYLDEDQLGRARELAGKGVEVDQSVVTYYTGHVADSALGVAYFDVHRVRTKREVAMVVVTPEARIERVEILRFDEPREYLPPDGWLEQFRGRELETSLSTRRGIAGITGATLTARSVTRATRRVLALHRVIDPLGSGDPGDGSGRGPGEGSGETSAPGSREPPGPGPAHGVGVEGELP